MDIILKSGPCWQLHTLFSNNSRLAPKTIIPAETPAILAGGDAGNGGFLVRHRRRSMP